LAELAAAAYQLKKRYCEQSNASCHDPGHDKAIEQAKKRFANAFARATHACAADAAALAEIAQIVAEVEECAALL
jgi:hypothetical protein